MAATIPLFQRHRASGSRQVNRAGIALALASASDPNSASVTWEIGATSLGGLAPQAGDLLRDTAGRWWQVVEAGAIANGVYPVKCDRVTKGGAA